MGGGGDATIASDSESLEDTSANNLKLRGQVRRELGRPQNTIVTGESCQTTTEALLNVLGGFQFSKAGSDVDSRFAKLKGEGNETEVGLEGNNPERNDREIQDSSASVNQQDKNYLENESESEDANLKKLRFLWGPEDESREEHRRAEMYRKIIHKRSMWEMQSGKIKDEKERLLRYKPGDWLVETGGMNKCKSSAESGSYFLQEYTIPGSSKAFCVFDSRGLSQSVTKDFPVLKKWMVNGIRHGEMVVRSSDADTVKMSMKHKAREGHYKLSKIRKVNFVIFVVNALSIIQIMDNGDIRPSDTLVKLFSCPYISFKDDKPIVVMTHGDELDDSNRIRAHIFLGQLLGVSSVDQVYDISDDHDLVTDMSLLDMLECALQRADINIPYKDKDAVEQFASLVKEINASAEWLLNTISKDEFRCFVIVVMLAILAWLQYSPRVKEPEIKWHRIRHLWYG